jgi:hypothetical protein
MPTVPLTIEGLDLDISPLRKKQDSIMSFGGMLNSNKGGASSFVPSNLDDPNLLVLGRGHSFMQN